jgi:hypothetical protein
MSIPAVHDDRRHVSCLFVAGNVGAQVPSPRPCGRLCAWLERYFLVLRGGQRLEFDSRTVRIRYCLGLYGGTCMATRDHRSHPAGVVPAAAIASGSET